MILDGERMNINDEFVIEAAAAALKVVELTFPGGSMLNVL